MLIQHDVCIALAFAVVFGCQRVELRGLSKTEYNGRCGTILGFQRPKDRYVVQLDPPTSDEQVKYFVLLSSHPPIPLRSKKQRKTTRGDMRLLGGVGGGASSTQAHKSGKH